MLTRALRAEEARAIDALKLLAAHVVTSDLLMKTEAGKKLKKISKIQGASEAIKSAANSCIDAWKDCVRLEQSKKAAAPKSEVEKVEEEPASGTGRENSTMSVSLASQQSLGDLGGAPTPKFGKSEGSKLVGQPARCNDATRNKV